MLRDVLVEDSSVGFEAGEVDGDGCDEKESAWAGEGAGAGVSAGAGAGAGGCPAGDLRGSSFLFWLDSVVSTVATRGDARI